MNITYNQDVYDYNPLSSVYSPILAEVRLLIESLPILLDQIRLNGPSDNQTWQLTMLN